jgi:hypothetical protein
VYYTYHRQLINTIPTTATAAAWNLRSLQLDVLSAVRDCRSL